MKNIIFLILFSFQALAAGPNTGLHATGGFTADGGLIGTGFVINNGYRNSLYSPTASAGFKVGWDNLDIAIIGPGFLATSADYFVTDIRGLGNRDTTLFSNAQTDTIGVTSDFNGGFSVGAGVKFYGHLHGTPEITKFYNAGALTGAIDAAGAWSMPLLPASSSAATGSVCWTTGGALTVDTTVACLASTRKIKKNIELLDTGLGIVMKLKPVAYDLKEERAHEGRQVGLVAEEVAEVDKRLVAMDEKGDPRAVRYQQLTAVLVKAIQEQQGQIADLRELVVEHDSELRTLRTEIYNLQSELRTIREE